MDADLALVIGIVVGVFSVPAVVSAYTEGRAPRVAAFAMIMAGILVAWALQEKPGGYRLSEIPDTLVKVVSRYVK